MKAILFACLALTSVCLSTAATVEWSGTAGDGVWTNWENWKDGVVPTEQDDVLIKGDETILTLQADTTVHSLTVSGSKCTIYSKDSDTSTMKLIVKTARFAGEGDNTSEYLILFGVVFTIQQEYTFSVTTLPTGATSDSISRRISLEKRSEFYIDTEATLTIACSVCAAAGLTATFNIDGDSAPDNNTPPTVFTNLGRLSIENTCAILLTDTLTLTGSLQPTTTSTAPLIFGGVAVNFAKHFVSPIQMPIQCTSGYATFLNKPTFAAPVAIRNAGFFFADDAVFTSTLSGMAPGGTAKLQVLAAAEDPQPLVSIDTWNLEFGKYTTTWTLEDVEVVVTGTLATVPVTPLDAAVTPSITLTLANLDISNTLNVAQSPAGEVLRIIGSDKSSDCILSVTANIVPPAADDTTIDFVLGGGMTVKGEWAFSPAHPARQLQLLANSKINFANDFGVSTSPNFRTITAMSNAQVSFQGPVSLDASSDVFVKSSAQVTFQDTFTTAGALTLFEGSTVSFAKSASGNGKLLIDPTVATAGSPAMISIVSVPAAGSNVNQLSFDTLEAAGPFWVGLAKTQLTVQKTATLLSAASTGVFALTEKSAMVFTSASSTTIGPSSGTSTLTFNPEATGAGWKSDCVVQFNGNMAVTSTTLNISICYQGSLPTLGTGSSVVTTRPLGAPDCPVVPSPSPSDDSKVPTTGVIVGVVLLGAAILSVAVLLYIRRRKEQQTVTGGGTNDTTYALMDEDEHL